MLEETQTKQQAHQTGSGEQNRSAAENIRQLTDASKQLLEAGKQMADNLSELSDRVEHVTDVGSQVLKSPWLFATGAIVAGSIMIALSRRH